MNELPSADTGEAGESLPAYGFLGPAGTFAEAALLATLGTTPADPVPYADVSAALAAVRRGDVVGAMVPIENSVEGAVAATLDELASGDPLVIIREQHVAVDFALMARPGTALQDVTRVATHPHAEAQCRRWLAANLPAARFLPAASTAGQPPRSAIWMPLTTRRSPARSRPGCTACVVLADHIA